MKPNTETDKTTFDALAELRSIQAVLNNAGGSFHRVQGKESETSDCYEAARRVTTIIQEHAALQAALNQIAEIAKDGVIHRHETGKPQWSAFDEITKLVSAGK